MKPLRLPEHLICWRCKAEGNDNFKMEVKVNVTLPVENYMKLPRTIHLQPNDVAYWDGVSITCKKCQSSYQF